MRRSEFCDGYAVSGERGDNIYNRSMKARVYVSFKNTVLDPQGQTICHALNGLGHNSIADVRQGKFFDIEVAPGGARGDIEREINQIAQDVLANPVIEEYRVEILD
jgi:phosphoribosylformylglycinamidine synthase subunit PurS